MFSGEAYFLEEGKLEKYWDVVAFETEREELEIRLNKWKKAARNWLAHYAEKKTYDFISQTFQKYVTIRENAEILDVGCGPGKWVNFFAERGFKVTGVDISPWMIRLAKKRLKNGFKTRVKFFVMDVAKLDLPDNFYDMVNCVTVLQHIFDDKKVRRAIHEMVRVAKPLGYILLFEAAPSFHFKNKTPHVHYISMKTYIREFAKAGAQLIYWRATDLSFPITFFGLRKYAATFSKKAYYFLASRPSFSPNFLSFLSKILVLLAKPLDYGLADSPLGFLSIGKILLFRKVKKY